VTVKTIIRTALVAMLVLTGAFVVMTRHVVWEHGNDAELLWRQDEALLFINASRTGWSGNIFQWSWQVGRNYLQLPTQIRKTAISVVVIRLTSIDVERYVFENTGIGSVAVFDDRIYAAVAGGPDRGSLAKWSRVRFEPVGADERQRVAAGKIPCSQPGCEFSDVRGWSHRCCVLSRIYEGETKFPMMVSGQQLVLTVSADPEHGSTTIDLQRVNRGTQRLWSVDEGARRVTADQYAAFLKQ
jgi:hypothetical protein